MNRFSVQIPQAKEQHLDEICAIKSIFCEDQCSEYSQGHLDVECIFDIQPILPSPEFQVFYVYENPPNPIDFGSIFVKNLPPIRLYLKLPSSYPSKNPPEYTLSISWLPPWESSKACQKLDEIWEENQGSEILLLWIDFLKKDLLEFLGMNEKLEISYLFTLSKHQEDFFFSQPIQYRDSRVSKSQNRCPIKFLEDYDNKINSLRFSKGVHFCGICLERKRGAESFEFTNCKHVFCRNCLEQYLNSKINQGSVSRISCPKSDCGRKIEYKEIQDICREEIFAKFEGLLLRKTINTMKDAVPCARKICQYPVIRENVDDNLATCANCRYSFCVFCRKGYHGVSPCEMSREETKKLINEYQNASNQGKKLLELKHGKKQIEIVVERHLTKEYLEENAKPCPNCFSQTTKIQGCNKMTCVYCESNFCWLCGVLIELADPYQHFVETKNGTNACGGKLFDGAIPKDDILDDIEIEANLQFFQIQDRYN
ncbi:E3 ubiquitin-protein ligase RNF14-like isoform X2 [Belonocnema kinseyi]|uniref:E3 ubiquitin-protein ligase RNF14-like isoform X2 n=1 Tax=Belonocnema kinseyi TaxID=2817044 RepID=UPI00143DE1F8|nr:E3 ubiquitin-protein ligase RNF14-like isoform X2 [Belonocnema kinseyi]